jgi:peroxiredoxin
MSDIQSTVRAQTQAAEREWLAAWQRGPDYLRWTKLPLQVGDQAPNLELADAAGARVQLREAWANGPALLIFLRHFGCGCAVERVDRLQQEYDAYRQLGATVILIGQGEPERSAGFAERNKLPCPLWCDPERRAYRAFDLLEGQPSQVAYGMAEEYLRRDFEAGAALQRSRQGTDRAPVDSPWQLPGEFLIDQAGLIRLAYRSQYCADYGEPQVLLAALTPARWQGGMP